MDNDKVKQQVERFYEKVESRNRKEKIEERQKEIEEIVKVSGVQTEEEEALYKKFCEIANADPDQKFKFEHIEALNTGAKVVVIYGKKGIGKTYQISKIIGELAEEDPDAQVILMRNTISEFKVLEKQLLVDYCPVKIIGKGNNPNLFHKEFLCKDSEKPRYMGFCACLSGFSLQSAKGSEYPNIRLIIWDECTNMGTSSAGYDKEDLFSFLTFFNSINRDKTNLKVYIFGNFHRQTGGDISDVLLDFLNIPYGCTLKIRDSETEYGTTSRILFINTGSLYKGIEADATLKLLANKQIQKDLYGNMPESYSSMIAGMNLFYAHKPLWGLMCIEGEDEDDAEVLLLLSSFEKKINEFERKINWMIHVESFPTSNSFVHHIYTTRVSLFNKYHKDYDIRLCSAQEERLLIHDLYSMCQAKSLYYTSDVSARLFDQLMHKWQDKHDLGMDVCFWKEKRKRREGF